ncbi:MAG: hypothetical protein S4CHLAM45_09130 [Chlamydiales bacterium]|nr:hypothetical protein [Chlamydiales bacterium]MCH9620535.1 hypothetical protein [Chlamydiales bacterium]MCH9623017.1 hypothetical protein [Chlamydiales bacterium]
MKDERFKIYVDRLKEGDVESIEETLDPIFIDVENEEGELKFDAPVEILGEAFVSGENFILRLGVKTEATMSCAICNEELDVPLTIPPIMHMEKLCQVKAGIFQLAPVVREAILLEVPHRAECNSGNCPEREKLKKYFSKEN